MDTAIDQLIHKVKIIIVNLNQLQPYFTRHVGLLDLFSLLIHNVCVSYMLLQAVAEICYSCNSLVAKTV